MNYPAFLDTFNLYIDGELKIENAPCPKHPRPRNASFEAYSEVSLLPILSKIIESDWKETQESKEGQYQQGMRCVFEFRNSKGVEAAFFVRADEFDALTNVAMKQPSVSM